MSTKSASSNREARSLTSAGQSPIFIAGPDRSGTTLMFGLLAAHPNISMTRRSNMWRYFYDRYGDLSVDENALRCIDDMVRYRKMGHLMPDRDQIRAEFFDGPRSYGRLFSIFHLQHARRSDKPRWGDKSLHNELFADEIFREFPEARMIHMVRDPRDRYASVSRRHGQNISRLGGVSGRWNRSVDLGLRNARLYPDNYLFVKYEDLASSPEKTTREVCDFIGEEFDEQMLELPENPDIQARKSNSSFGDLGQQTISTKAIGRFREVLEPREIAFIQTASAKGMKIFDYPPVDVDRSQLGAGFYLAELPWSWGRMWAWRGYAWLRRWRGLQLPQAKMLDPGAETPGDGESPA